MDAIIIVDKRGQVRFVNPAAENLFVQKAAVWLGKPFEKVITPNEVTEFEITRENAENVVAEMHAEEIEWEDEMAYLVNEN